MTRYEWLLFLHVLAAFSLVAAFVLFWAVTLIGLRGDPTATRVVMPALLRPAGLLVGLGTAFTLVFGVWLAIDVDGYELWDGWILTSLILWAFTSAAGQRSGVLFQRLGAAQPGTEALAVRNRALLLQTVSTLGILVILVLMIFRPGA